MKRSRPGFSAPTRAICFAPKAPNRATQQMFCFPTWSESGLPSSESGLCAVCHSQNHLAQLDPVFVQHMHTSQCSKSLQSKDCQGWSRHGFLKEHDRLRTPCVQVFRTTTVPIVRLGKPCACEPHHQKPFTWISEKQQQVSVFFPAWNSSKTVLLSVAEHRDFPVFSSHRRGFNSLMKDVDVQTDVEQ